ncbi:MAG: 6-phosphogluconolactonase, partial [Pedobacter sp.]
MNLLIYKTIEELTEDLADYIIKIAEVSIEENDRFNFVLTGGSSPKALYHFLAKECEHRIDWEK